MPSALPPALSRCLEKCLAFPSQCLVTSVLDASSNWLVIRMLSAAIHGTDSEERGPIRNPATGQRQFKVVFISFLRPLDLWLELGKKINLDIASLINSQQLVYIDGLTGGKSPSLRSHNLQDISTSIASARQVLSSPTETATANHLIVLDGIDFVLASQPEISQPQLSQFLLNLREGFANVIVTGSSDSPLLHGTEATSSLLELNHAIFLRVASYQSSLILQVRALETGFAKDVSGVFRMSKGGAYVKEFEDLTDGEWLYQVKGDGSLRVWTRGE